MDVRPLLIILYKPFDEHVSDNMVILYERWSLFIYVHLLVITLEFDGTCRGMLMVLQSIDSGDMLKVVYILAIT